MHSEFKGFGNENGDRRNLKGNQNGDLFERNEIREGLSGGLSDGSIGKLHNGILADFSAAKIQVGVKSNGLKEGDLQERATAGYSILWLLMWSAFIGLLIRLLSLRFGVATGRRIAGILLWLMTELSLRGADIQEVIGSAIAIMIFRCGVLPLWAGFRISALYW